MRVLAVRYMTGHLDASVPSGGSNKTVNGIAAREKLCIQAKNSISQTLNQAGLNQGTHLFGKDCQVGKTCPFIQHFTTTRIKLTSYQYLLWLLATSQHHKYFQHAREKYMARPQLLSKRRTIAVGISWKYSE